jgi:hypothetical protein
MLVPLNKIVFGKDNPTTKIPSNFFCFLVVFSSSKFSCYYQLVYQIEGSLCEGSQPRRCHWRADSTEIHLVPGKVEYHPNELVMSYIQLASSLNVTSRREVAITVAMVSLLR